MWKPLAATALLVLMPACAGRSPLQGWLYTGVQSGLGVTAQAGPKHGESCAWSLLGTIAVGDASIETARKNGGVTSISIVDEKAFAILGGLYATHCTVVYGK